MIIKRSSTCCGKVCFSFKKIDCWWGKWKETWTNKTCYFFLLTVECLWENFLPQNLHIFILRLMEWWRHSLWSLRALKFCDLKKKAHIIAMFNGICDNWKIIAAPNFYYLYLVMSHAFTIDALEISGETNRVNRILNILFICSLCNPWIPWAY